jgi:hypothetical protein
MDRIVVSASRHDRCEVKLYDQGERLVVPVCMGGMAILGCSNSERCSQVLNERHNDPSSALILFVDEKTGIVHEATSVPRHFVGERPHPDHVRASVDIVSEEGSQVIGVLPFWIE